MYARYSKSMIKIQLINNSPIMTGPQSGLYASLPFVVRASHVPDENICGYVVKRELTILIGDKTIPMATSM
ncbi:hypothetical protein Lery_1720 [Legionella erythra]|uniref:Uncharacterized protein n=1 Tax=Legionella erythra TaxID=448 RepID=A0A0W0TPD7_LEGER|nr:hypothetical protein Lery_1720 [Legionella erythra]